MSSALFAANELPVSGWVLAIIILAAIVVFLFVLLLTTRYKRCPSNRVLVIFGKMTGSPTGTRCLHGGARLVLPLIQDYAYLTLEPLQIEIPLKGALSIENIRVNVPSVFTVAIGTNPETMQNAAIRLLGLEIDEVKQQVQDIIFGQLRQVIASMRIEDINRDREKFLESIQMSLEPELAKIGLVLINVNITDITDESGYIEAIGRKAASKAIQKAKVDVAEQEKMGQIGVAEADRERAVQVANANKVREIGTQEAMREQAVRVAELAKEQKFGEEKAAYERDALIKEAERAQAIRIANFDKEQKVGEQRAAYEREIEIKDADREKRIRTADANAKAIAGETDAQAEIAHAQAELKVKQADAYQLGETRKREAEAAVEEAQNLAFAKAALAEAQRVENERRAELEAPAKAEKAKRIVEAEALAEKHRIEAEGEAKAIFAKLDAEARGQYEVLAKKGQGLKEIILACGGSKEAFQLLMLEHLDKLAETAAQAISNIKFEKVVVWEGGANGQNGTGQSNTSQFLQSMARTMPPMMQIMKDIGGVELPDYIARFEQQAADAKPDESGTDDTKPEGNASDAKGTSKKPGGKSSGSQSQRKG